MAIEAVDRLFDLLPPLDIGNPKAFLAAAAAIFSDYPKEIVDQSIFEIARRSDRPTLKTISAVTEELYDRALERERLNKTLVNPAMLPRPPRTPEEQARIDALAADTRKAFGLPPEGLPKISGQPKHSPTVNV